MAATRLRSMRIPDEIWEPAARKAKDEGVTVTSLVIAMLREYAKPTSS